MGTFVIVMYHLLYRTNRRTATPVASGASGGGAAGDDGGASVTAVSVSTASTQTEKAIFRRSHADDVSLDPDEECSERCELASVARPLARFFECSSLSCS